MKNKIINRDNYSEIEIKSSKGIFYCKIDTEDIEKVQLYRWHMQNKYVACKFKGSHLYLHRYLMNPNKDMQVDHKNRNTLDNRKINLRMCTQQKNLQNKSKNSNDNCTYIYPSGKKWRAVITYANKQLYLGMYKTKQEAQNIINSCLKNIIWQY